MEETPKRELLKSLIVKICEEQEKILRIIGPPKSSLQSHAADLEALKTPIYFVWEMLGYGDFPQSRVQHQWLASFKASPPDFLSECIVQIKNVDIPVDDLNMRRTLIDFYSELQETFKNYLL